MKFEQGLQEAKKEEEDILRRLEQLPGGKSKAKKTKKVISILRNYAGFREYNKYVLVWYLWIIKQALMKEADKMVERSVISGRKDIYYLTFEELREAVNLNKTDYSIITKRNEEHKVFKN
jgi:pyruvate,water dikinase